MSQRESQALGAFLDAYAASCEDESKPATVINTRRVASDLAAFFGAGLDLKGVTPRGPTTSAGTTPLRSSPPPGSPTASPNHARRLKVARMLFKHALARGLVRANPFADVKGPASGPNPDRQVYVPRGDVRRVLAVCNPEWQVIVALSRFAGPVRRRRWRTGPSEVFSLRWADVDLAAGRMVVRSPKTEHHQGGASRVVPIFPDLRPYLEDAFVRVGDAGAVYVVNGVGERGREKAPGKTGWNGCNLSVPFTKMVEPAGLTPWPKPVHDMRASCETDPMRDHPIHVVCSWLGNTPNVALGHYLRTLDWGFAKAIERNVGGGAESGAAPVQNAVQSQADGSSLWWTGG